MPDVEIETTISSSVTIEVVAVNVKDVPAFSKIELAEVDKGYNRSTFIFSDS